MEFRRAIVREPGRRYADCISSHPQRRSIDLDAARAQHRGYVAALQDLGLEIIRLARDDEHPDSCFVEDCAVVHRAKAFVCRAARESRRGEEGPITETLAQYMPVGRASAPATLEGGDVVHLEDGLISGLTQRTNAEGVAQMEEYLDAEVETVKDPSIVHLKSYVNYLGNGRMLSVPKYAENEVLKRFETIVVPAEDWYSTNVIALGDRVLMAAGYPRTQVILEEAGFRVQSLAMSEFPKCEGALTCLSVLF